ncbi:MAG: hypothetical protein GX793_01325 [Bacteroidales bacterium]|jgi:hypothetical protein|nr:hypothetical protein [Bacteroidales bacterium]MCK9498641.1 hypothetical protein [Bacteroidales bacterium]MDY0314803.1 hypothetical protein [Bacteroidales bacterium]NLB85679.1 hypothetical protein [Bacteroidales bacterium]
MKGFRRLHLFVLFSLLLCNFTLFSQTQDFLDISAKTKQSYLDRGYKLVDYASDSIIDISPLVSSNIDLDFKTYYIVHVQIDACVFCEYDLYFVDNENNMYELNPEFIVENNLKQAVYRFNNNENSSGKYVVILKSELPYFANIFVFKKKF